MSIGERLPFDEEGPDEREIRGMLVERDSEAFVAQDWDRVADDFVTDGFYGIDSRRSADPSRWTMRFPSLEAYRDEWLRQARETAETAEPSLALRALSLATTLDRIDIDGDVAIAHKKFDGFLPNRDGSVARLLWRTVYVVRRTLRGWKIASFVGYLPHAARAESARYVAAETQHKTAGPYSPAMGVRAGGEIVVLSGQAPLDDEGRVIGDTIEAQARVALENCARQLAAAGLALSDVFKATVYMTDLRDWSAFNEVYREYMREPYPARTAIEAGLLSGMLVEIEMWAVKP